MKLRTVAAAVAVTPILATVTAGSAWATKDHSDPCPGQHIQVWADLGGKGIDNGGAEATDHFVCVSDMPAGPAGPQGEKGDPGQDSTVPGPQGPAGPQGPKGDTVVGPEGPQGPQGNSIVGPQGTAGKDGKDGRDCANASELDSRAASALEGGSSNAGADSGSSADQNPGGVSPLNCTGPAGAPGKPGVDGHDGAPGAPGKNGVTKTVIVNQDGTTTTVTKLPHTGGSEADLWIGLIAAGVVLAGGATVYWTRKF